jgi:uncharacterized repeat protein (TIGR03809 family)
MPPARAGAGSPSIGQAWACTARVALKWRDLAERRRAHFIDLHESGRWKRYYTDDEFEREMRGAAAIAQRWARIALQSEQLASPAELPRPKAAA